MQELIGRLAATVKVEPALAGKALGTFLSFLVSQGDPARVAELFARLPGAAELAEAHTGRSLFGRFGGSLGAGMAAFAKLQATGLDAAQIKALGTETLAYAKEKAGPECLARAVNTVPGLKDYL